MQVPQYILISFNAAGLVLTIASIVVVKKSSSLIMQSIKKGFLSLNRGLYIVALSFIWALGVNLGLLKFPEMQTILISIGMIFFLVSFSNLFKIHIPGKNAAPSDKGK